MKRSAPILVLLALAPALVGWNPFVRRNPEVRRGAEAYREGQYDRALEHFGKAEESAPGAPEVAFGKGAALYKQGDAAAARADDPEKAAGGKAVYEQAAQAFQSALSSPDPRLKARAYYDLGNAQARQGAPDKAIDSYVKALMLDPKLDDAKANLELARIFLEQRQKQDPRESDKGRKQEQESKDDKQEQQSRSQEQEDKRQQPTPDEQEAKGEDKTDEPQEAKSETPEPKEQSAESQNPLAEEREGEMSKEQAERLLDSLRRQEVNLQHWNRMMEEYKDRKMVVEKDW